MKLITDYKTAQSSVGVEASTNFSFAGFSGGASLGMSSKIATSGNDIGFSYYATKIGLKTAAKSQIGLTDMGRKYFLAYASANGDSLLEAASELIRQCGANIIMSEQRGASYQVMAKLSSSYSSSVKELAASAQGSGSFIEVSSKFDSSQSNTNQAFSLNIERQSNGQDLNYPELSDAISQCSLNEDGTINQSCKDIFSKYAGKILGHIQDPSQDYEVLPQVGLPTMKPLSEFDPEDILDSDHETALNKAVGLYQQQYDRLQNTWLDQNKLYTRLNGMMQVYSGHNQKALNSTTKSTQNYTFGSVSSTENILDRLKLARNNASDNVEQLKLALFACSDGICKESQVNETLKNLKTIDASIMEMVNKVQPVALGELKGIEMPTGVTNAPANAFNCNDEIQVMFNNPEVESVIIGNDKVTPNENYVVKMQGLCSADSKITRIPIFVTLKSGEVGFRFINSLPGKANKFAISNAMELSLKNDSEGIKASCSDNDSSISLLANMMYEELNSMVAIRVYSIGSCSVYGTKIDGTKHYGLPDKQRRIYIEVMETKGKEFMPTKGTYKK